MKRGGGIRVVMRRKIRLSDVILSEWRKKFIKRHKSLVSGSPLRAEDLDREFEREGRTFKVIGLTSLDSILLSEQTEDGLMHWEASQPFVQMCLGRRNESFIRNPTGGFGTWEVMEYNTAKMFLPPTSPVDDDPEPQQEERAEEEPVVAETDSIEQLED